MKQLFNISKRTFLFPNNNLVPFAIIIATLSVYFEHVFREPGVVQNFSFEFVIIVFLLALCVIGACFKKTNRASLALFFLIHISTTFVFGWFEYANHGWLALWTIPLAVLFKEWWLNKDYQTYIRYTLGFVMIAAGVQKLIAGTYLDGSLLTFLSYTGSSTEQLFSSLCVQSSEMISCAWHKVLGIIIVMVQFLVGIFLIIGSQNRYVIITEIGFLLAAGIYADELNFQVLVFSLMCIAFGYRMSAKIAVICLVLLVVDVVGVSSMIDLIKVFI